MNPKSRMVIFAVLALAAPALLPSLSQASMMVNGKPYYWDPATSTQQTVTPVEVPGNPAWMQVTSKSDGKTYYVPKSKVVALAENKSCELYDAVGAAKALDNVELYRFKTTERVDNEPYVLNYVIVFNHSLALLADRSGSKPLALDLKAPAAVTENRPPGLPATLYVSVMQMIKDKNPGEYKKIKEGGEAATRKVYAAMNEAVASYSKAHPGKSLDAKGIHAALTTSAKGQKSRLQAALDEDTAAAAPKPPTQLANQTARSDGAGQPDEKSGGSETNPVTILTRKLIKSPKEVGESMAARIADYIVDGNAQGFIAKDLRDKHPEVVERIKKLPAAWVAAKVKQDEAVAVAQLYFVMGAGDQAPSWLAGDTALAGALTNQNAERTAKFIESMKPWTRTPPDANGVGQCTQTDAAIWVQSFLGTEKGKASYAASAVQISSAILNNPTVLKELGEIAHQIQSRAEGIAVPTTGPGAGGGQPITGSAKGFDYNSLFRSGAKVAEFVYQDGDKVSRAISIKMYTVKENGALVNKIGVFDITNSADTFGQKFSISAGANKTTFALDDRVAGKPKYTLEFTPSGGDTLITFGREDNAKQMQTSVSQLFTLRAQQAIDEGNVTKVGDKSYYVLGQGGAKGSLLFFPSDLKDSLASGGNLSPEMAAEVNQRGPDGGNQSIPYKVGRDLGTAADGKPYHLEFNRDNGYWEVKDGPGDQDPAPGAATSTTTATGGQTGGTGPKPGTLLETVKATLRGGNYEIDPISKDLNQDLKDKEIEIWTFKLAGKPPLGYWHVWIFPAELSSARNMPMPMSAELPLSETADELHLIDGHVVAITRSWETLFYDLARPAKVVIEDDKAKNHPFENVGKISKSSFNISDAALFKSTLDLSKFPLKGKTAQDVQKNLDAVMKLREGTEIYTIQGGMDSGTIDIHLGGNRLFGQFWPKIADNLNSAAGHADTAGPGHAFDFALVPDVPFQDQASILEEKDVNPAESVVVIAKAGDDTARLYANGDNSRWYLAYRFAILDDKGKTVEVRRNGRPGLAFASDPKLHMPIPAVPIEKVGLRGLKNQGIPDGQFRYAGKAEKGLWYAVKRKGGTPENETKSADNCLGPVVWWGMDEPAALKACKDDKL
ncbi:MAG: hypothetical protein NTY77_09360 [Elusimicrobia bacterium]|nr:hypothetical protein [Elusimicrobiota bacterium]